VVVVHRDPNLLQVVHALRSPRGLAGRLDGRQEQGHQNPNDGDHHQQLDQRKTDSTTT